MGYTAIDNDYGQRVLPLRIFETKEQAWKQVDELGLNRSEYSIIFIEELTDLELLEEKLRGQRWDI